MVITSYFEVFLNTSAFIYSKGVSEVDNMPYGDRSPPKQVSGSPLRGKQRESRKGPETEIAEEHPDETPPRPRSSTPHSGQEKPGPVSGMAAGTHKVKTYFTISNV